MVDSNEVVGRDLVLVIDSIADAQDMVGVNSGNNLVCAEDGVGVDGLLVGDVTTGVGGMIVLDSLVEDGIWVKKAHFQKGPVPKWPVTKMA